ncbi:MAG: two-component system sensor histidine kinase CreC, partial [Pseudomonadales bacterium]|nr:two-component system sensor histidine kinase CreC [Pseudomonadales bacterium]
RGLTRYAEAIRQGQTPEPPVPGETELARLAGAMEDMRQELEGKAYVETFVHELTHELKSPVSAIKGASEILQDQLSTPEAQHFLANIDTETQRIDEMVNRLLKLVSIEKQAVLDAPVDTDLQDVVQQVLRSKETQMQRQSLRADTTQLSAARVRGDVFLLVQAVDNLLQNAIDFSPPATKIQISTDRDATTVRLSICDQGPGIPDYAVHKVFNRFYSLPRPASGKKSTGLGLGFVRQIMRLHQGDVLLRPQPVGSGTCAVLSFPAKSS